MANNCGDTIRWEWESTSFHQGTCTLPNEHVGEHSMIGDSTDKKRFKLVWAGLEMNPVFARTGGSSPALVQEAQP